MQRTLLLTGFPPDSHSGGAVIVRSLVRHFPACSLDWMAFWPPRSALPEPIATQYKGELPVPPSWGSTRLHMGPLWKWWKHVWTDPLTIRRLAKLVNDRAYDVVWMVLDAPRARVAAGLVKALPNTRFHFSVHDHPVYSAAADGIPQALISKIKSDLHGIGATGASVDAVSEELLSELGWPTAHQCLVTAPVDSDLASLPFRTPSPNGELRVTLVGNYIGDVAVQRAIGGFREWGAQRGRSWRLDIYGRTDDSLQQPNVFTHAHQDLATIREDLLKTDLFLLPLGFNADKIDQMRTSLPTKLVTYAEFGRVVLTYTLPGTAAERIVRDCHLGPVVNELSAQATIGAIDEALSWNVEAASGGRDRLNADRFCNASIWKRFCATMARGPVE